MTAVDDYRDADLEALAYDKPGLSGLEELAADVEQEVAEPTRLLHPSLPGYVLVFRSHVDSAEAQSIEKRTKNSKAAVRDRNALFLATVNTGIEKNGAVVENSKGKPITFRDPELLETLGVRTAAAAVVKFLKENDGHIIALADKVATKAGYGAEVEEAPDPT
jgi:hypothetical protein